MGFAVGIGVMFAASLWAGDEMPRRWDAKWIWREGETSGVNLIWLARKSFELEAPPRTARIFITADSHYRLYVNGQFALRGPARCVPERQAVDSMDVASLLKQGANTLAVLVHHYGIDTGRYNLGKPGLLVQLEADGQVIASDRSWRGMKGEAWASHTVRNERRQGFVEILDFRRYPDGWEKPDYSDSRWRPAGEIPWPDDWPVNNPPASPRAVMRPWVSLVPRGLPLLDETPVGFKRIASRQEAIEYRKLPVGRDVALEVAQDILVPLQYCRIEGDGPLTIVNGPTDQSTIQVGGIRSAHVVLDLGEARNGYATIEMEGPAGTTVDVSYAPHLVGGRIVPTLMAHRNADRLVLSGRTDRWEAIEWRNFRYLGLTVRGTRGPVQIFRAGMKRIDYPFRKEGFLEVEDDPRLSSLWRAAARTVELVTTDAYQDNYREQYQYAGTSYYAARANYAAFGDTLLQRRYLRQMPLSMMSDGVMLPAYPGGGDQGRRVILEYNLLWVMGLADYVEYSGDWDTARELMPVLERVLRRFGEMEDERGLLDSPPYGYWIDHANIDRRGASFPLNAIYLVALEAAARLKAPSAKEYEGRAAKLRRALNEHFWDGKRRLFADANLEGKLTGRFSEHANAMAIATGIVTGDRAQQVARELLRADATGIVRDSTLFLYWFAEGLFKIGLGREALGMLKERYAHMLDSDHGTLWEESSLLASARSGEWAPNSRALAQAENTYPAYTLSRWLLGVDPVSARGSALKIRYTGLGLRAVRGALPTANGRVEIAWRDDEEALSLDVSVPPGVSGEVELASIVTPGRSVTLDGKNWTSASNPTVGPGRHRIVARRR